MSDDLRAISGTEDSFSPGYATVSRKLGRLETFATYQKPDRFWCTCTGCLTLRANPAQAMHQNARWHGITWDLVMKKSKHTPFSPGTRAYFIPRCYQKPNSTKRKNLTYRTPFVRNLPHDHARKMNHKRKKKKVSEILKTNQSGRPQTATLTKYFENEAKEQVTLSCIRT